MPKQHRAKKVPDVPAMGLKTERGLSAQKTPLSYGQNAARGVLRSIEPSDRRAAGPSELHAEAVRRAGCGPGWPKLCAEALRRAGWTGRAPLMAQYHEYR